MHLLFLYCYSLHDEIVDIEGYNLEEMKGKRCDFMCFHARHMALAHLATKMPVCLTGHVAAFTSETINQLTS